MTSVRARILIPVLVLILLGDALISWLVLRDSHHEIEEVYDAQLAQSARLLQGVLRQRDPGEADWDRPVPGLRPGHEPCRRRRRRPPL